MNPKDDDAEGPGGMRPAGSAASRDLDDTFARIAELLEFPADFPIKVMGVNQAGFVPAVAEVVRTHVPGFDSGDISQTASTKGRFLSLTIELRVDSREQLQALYQALADHEMVRIVL